MKVAKRPREGERDGARRSGPVEFVKLSFAYRLLSDSRNVAIVVFGQIFRDENFK